MVEGPLQFVDIFLSQSATTWCMVYSAKQSTRPKKPQEMHARQHDSHHMMMHRQNAPKKDATKSEHHVAKNENPMFRKSTSM